MPIAETSKLKVRAHRERQRALGLRPIQVWVLDTRAPKFRAAAQKQSLAVARRNQDEDDRTFIDLISENPFVDHS